MAGADFYTIYSDLTQKQSNVHFLENQKELRAFLHKQRKLIFLVGKFWSHDAKKQGERVRVVMHAREKTRRRRRRGQKEIKGFLPPFTSINQQRSHRIVEQKCEHQAN